MILSRNPIFHIFHIFHVCHTPFFSYITVILLEQVDLSFKKVHQVQQSFQDELGKLTEIASPEGTPAPTARPVGAQPTRARKGTSNQAALGRARLSHGRSLGLAALVRQAKEAGNE